jgi:hypothetical protein
MKVITRSREKMLEVMLKRKTRDVVFRGIFRL